MYQTGKEIPPGIARKIANEREKKSILIFSRSHLQFACRFGLGVIQHSVFWLVVSVLVSCK